VLVLVHQFCVLAVQDLAFFSLFQIHESVGLLLGLALHQEHPSLFGFLDLFGKFLLFHLLQFSLLLLFLLILIEGLGFCFGYSLPLSLIVLFLASPFLLLLLGQFLPMSHDHILFAID
jgi:hypothetical protein